MGVASRLKSNSWEGGSPILSNIVELRIFRPGIKTETIGPMGSEFSAPEWQNRLSALDGTFDLQSHC